MKRGRKFLLEEPEKWFAVHSNQLLRTVKFDLVDGNWRMVVAIDDARGNHLVAFITQSSIGACWDYLYGHYTTTNTPLKWYTDKYYGK